jgi:molybdopterin-guanine dinucleotide biosynthesis protein A
MASGFISHRSSDTVMALRLKDDLEARGHRLWIDALEIDVGDSIVAKMDAGLASASHLLLCLSASGVDAPWISREWMSALARQMNGADIKLLPVLLPGGSIPGLLADVRYADLRSDWKDGITDLDEALSK